MPERVLIYLWCKIGSYYRKHFAIMGQKCCMAAWLCFVVNKHAAVLVCTLHTMGVPPLSNSANRAEKFLLSRLQMFAKIFLRCMLSISFSLSLSLGPRGDELLYLSARNSFNGYLFWLSQQPATTLTVVSGSLNSLLHMYNSDRICFSSLSSLLQL